MEAVCLRSMVRVRGCECMVRVREGECEGEREGNCEGVSARVSASMSVRV